MIVIYYIDATHLELIPCLAYLSDTLEYKQMSTHQNEAITKLISCLGKQCSKSFMRQCWVKLYFCFTERCRERLDLTQSIELLIFLLEKMPPLVDLSRKPSITNRKALKIQKHAKLLTTTFSCCKYFPREDDNDYCCVFLHACCMYVYMILSPL